MALINCPECGKEVSDKSRNCIHCGYPFDEQTVIVHSDKINEVQNVKRKSKIHNFNVLESIKSSKQMKIIAVMIVLVILIVGVVAIISSSFSQEEEYGLTMVKKYQDMLKNPDSLILRSDIAVISYYRDGKTHKYVFFDSSGENSYGGSITSTPCFVNGQYLCDSDEIPSASEYMNMSDATAKKYLGLQLALAHWKMYGEEAAVERDDVVDSYSVSAEKIAKKLKIESKVK